MPTQELLDERVDVRKLDREVCEVGKTVKTCKRLVHMLLSFLLNLGMEDHGQQKCLKGRHHLQSHDVRLRRGPAYDQTVLTVSEPAERQRYMRGVPCGFRNWTYRCMKSLSHQRPQPFWHPSRLHLLLSAVADLLQCWVEPFRFSERVIFVVGIISATGEMLVLRENSPAAP